MSGCNWNYWPDGVFEQDFTIAEYEKALEKMNSRGALKIAVKPS